MAKTSFMRWVDAQLGADPCLAEDVDALIAEMKLEQELVALREKRGISQRQLAKLLGTSQPYVAKLESGRVKNLGVRTLVKCARALGASVTIRIASIPRFARSRSGRRRRSEARRG